MGELVPILSDSSVRTSRTTAFGLARLEPLACPPGPAPARPDAAPASAEHMTRIADPTSSPLTPPESLRSGLTAAIFLRLTQIPPYTGRFAPAVRSRSAIVVHLKSLSSAVQRDSVFSRFR